MSGEKSRQQSQFPGAANLRKSYRAEPDRTPKPKSAANEYKNTLAAPDPLQKLRIPTQFM